MAAVWHLKNIFWNETIWLPDRLSWDIIRKQERANYAQFNDLYYAFPVAMVLLFVRLCVERFIFTPLGICFGLKATHPKKAADNPVLEKAFKANGRISYKQIQGLAKQLEWSERKIERWLRQRTVQQKKPQALSKFTESSWRFTFYTTTFLYGFYTLYDKQWFWDTKYCWYDYPDHSVTNDIWWYYMIELGFYWSLTFSQFMDVKRKLYDYGIPMGSPLGPLLTDIFLSIVAEPISFYTHAAQKDFFQMFIHHIITIMLLSFSWACNFWRIGTLVLVIHDFADIPLELTKMAKYIGHQQVTDSLFLIFAVAWIISRLGLFPCRVIYSTLFEAVAIIDMFPAYYIFNGLLCGLQILHLVWSWIILRIAFQAVSKGVKDLRSDASSESSCSENISHDHKS